MLTENQLDGNSISWQCDDYALYTTNHGQVKVDRSGEVMDCCVGIDRGNYHSVSVKILGDEFQVYEEDINGRVRYELHSPNFPYPKNTQHTISILSLIEVIRNSTNNCTALLLVKKRLLTLILSRILVNSKELSSIKSLLQEYRVPIISRQPIINRQPIRRRK